jgi:membrane-associated phospholipid phosphatase
MADLDMEILRVMRTRGHAPALERGARLLGKAGNNGIGWLVAGAALAAADKRRRPAWAAAGVLGPAAIGLNYGIKLLARRPRPVLKGLPPLGGAPSSLSFPSAHSTSSFAVATAMTRIDRRAAVAFVPAIAVAAGRPYLGMHYPSDVVAGVVLGTALGLAVPLPRSEAPLPPKAPAAEAPAVNGSGPTSPTPASSASAQESPPAPEAPR